MTHPNDISGKVLRGVGVGKIKREDVNQTIEHVVYISGISEDDIHLLGSTGKSSTSGDIDIAVDVSKYNPQNLHDTMVRHLGTDNAFYNIGTRVGSYAVPIKGDPYFGLVQVDFMFVPNIEWAKFSYYSAGDTRTKYKGVVRTVLLRSVASVLYEHGVDLHVYDPLTNDLIVRIGRTMDMNIGIRRIYQIRPKKKNGFGYLSSMKTVTRDELINMYPDVHDGILEFNTINDPEEALNLIFGHSVKPSDVETAEQIIILINCLPEQKRGIVVHKARDNLKEMVKFTEDQLAQLFNGVTL
jgi:hypothetical protein